MSSPSPLLCCSDWAVSYAAKRQVNWSRKCTLSNLRVKAEIDDRMGQRRVEYRWVSRHAILLHLVLSCLCAPCRTSTKPWNTPRPSPVGDGQALHWPLLAIDCLFSIINHIVLVQDPFQTFLLYPPPHPTKRGPLSSGQNLLCTSKSTMDDGDGVCRSPRRSVVRSSHRSCQATDRWSICDPFFLCLCCAGLRNVVSSATYHHHHHDTDAVNRPSITVSFFFFLAAELSISVVLTCVCTRVCQWWWRCGNDGQRERDRQRCVKAR